MLTHTVVGHTRRSVIALSAAVLCCMLVAGAAQGARVRPGASRPASARITPTTPVTPGSNYLALGDSVTFGYEEPQVKPAPDYQDAASFRAYPEMLASELHLKLANLACPGETAASLLDATAQSNGCENAPKGGIAYRASFPLHVSYTGSQIAYAERWLRRHPNTRLVSLLIGANDLFLCREQTADGCAAASERTAALEAIAGHVRSILVDLRRTARYHGQIVIVDYYSLDYSSPLQNAFSRALNAAEAAGAKGLRVRFANAYATFAAAAAHSGNDTCTAGLLTQLGSPKTCGIHPSFAGQTLLASTVENAIRIR